VSIRDRVKKCPTCGAYYIPGKTKCNCAASMFPALVLKATGLITINHGKVTTHV
jgi:uncharacterized OB-fold protein